MGSIFSFFLSKEDSSKTPDDLPPMDDAEKSSSCEESSTKSQQKIICGVSYLEEIKSNGAARKTNLVDKVKAGLYSVRVSQADATQLQREMEGELFDKWNEGCEVMEARKVAIEDIQGFLDHLQEAYEDIDEEVRRKMSGIKWDEEWPYKVLELKQNVPDDSGAKYGIIAFGKSTDGKFVDCMYCLFKLDFKVAPERIVTTKERSILLGLTKWQTMQEEEHQRDLGVVSLNSIKNFFRFKALQGFYNEGLIDEINVVPSIEERSDNEVN